MLLFLFEYRAATLLIQEQFPGPVAAAIAKIEVDGDVISLDGRDPIHAESEMDADGRVRVRIRRSVSSAPESGLSSSVGFTPARLSNISGAEIYSLNTPGRHPMEQFTIADVTFGYRSTSPRLSGYASSDAYSLQPTPRESNFNEMEIGTPVWMRSPATAVGRVVRQQSPAVAKVVRGCQEGGSGGSGEGQGGKDVGGEYARCGAVLFCSLACCAMFMSEKTNPNLRYQ